MNSLKKLSLSVVAMAGSLALTSSVFAADAMDHDAFFREQSIKLANCQRTIRDPKSRPPDVAVAYAMLGDMYAFGLGTEPDPEIARIYREVALVGSDSDPELRAQVNLQLAQSLFHSTGAEGPDWERAESYVQEALLIPEISSHSKKRAEDIMINIAHNKNKKSNNLEEQQKEFQMYLADLHDPDAPPSVVATMHMVLGYHYMNGLGTPIDYAQARSHFEAALAHPAFDPSLRGDLNFKLGLITLTLHNKEREDPNLEKAGLEKAQDYFQAALSDPALPPELLAKGHKIMAALLDEQIKQGRVERDEAAITDVPDEGDKS